MKPIMSVEEVRKILGNEAEDMSDSDIEHVVSMLHYIAKDAVKSGKEQLLMNRDALRLVELTYDIYRGKKR